MAQLAPSLAPSSPGAPSRVWSRSRMPAGLALRPAAALPPRRERRRPTAVRAEQHQHQQQPSQQPQPDVKAAADEQQPSSSSSSSSSLPAILVGGALAAAALTAVGSPVAANALALEMHAEPANALSLPTWMVHTSSVIEWVVAMGLMWRYGEVSGNPRWKGMAWGMLPCLGSAMCACTWHFFYNSPDLQFLVALQAALTVVGNCTCWWAAYRIYQYAEQEAA